MNKDHLLKLLCSVYTQEISADEAFDELEDLIDRIKRLEEMYAAEIGEQPELLNSNVFGLLKRELNAATQRIKRLEQEVQVLRFYGNKDCTAQADAVLEAKEAKP